MTKKEETIEKYLDEFLKNRSEEQKSEFLSRSTDRQYASIMAWKHRQYGARKEMQDVESLIDGLRTVRKTIPLLTDMDDKDLKRLRKEIASLESAVTVYETQQREREIRELEAQQRELERRLAELRGID